MSIEAARELILKSERILVCTGAGISTGSGIADFRGPQGVWKRRRPVMIQEFLADPQKRVEYWEYKLEGHQSFRSAEPNAAHLSLRKLEEQGRLLAIVTQNIDGLHVAAGVAEDRVLELHGTNRLVACLDCDFKEDPERSFQEFASTSEPPRCPSCGGWLKPATISFGQQLDSQLLDRAFSLAEQADLVMALGSTLMVEPAASVPLAGIRGGVPYIVINQGQTAHDHLATVRLSGDLTELLPLLLRD